MKQTIQTKHLLNLNETCAAPLLEQFEYPWQALPHISDFIISLETLSPDEYDRAKAEHVWIARSATVFPSAYITGPTIIGPNYRSAPQYSSEKCFGWRHQVVAILPN